MPDRRAFFLLIVFAGAGGCAAVDTSDHGEGGTRAFPQMPARPDISVAFLDLRAFEPKVALLSQGGGASAGDVRWEARSLDGAEFALAIRSESGEVLVAASGRDATGSIPVNASERIALMAGPANEILITLRGVSHVQKQRVLPTTSTIELSNGDVLGVGARDLVATLERQGVGTFTLLAPDGEERGRLGVELATHVALDKTGDWRIGCDGPCVGRVIVMLRGYSFDGAP